MDSTKQAEEQVQPVQAEVLTQADVVEAFKDNSANVTVAGLGPKREKKPCSFSGCDKYALAHGLCWTHYQQQRRGRPLTPIRKRGLLLLPGNVRVEQTVHDTLQQRIQDGKAKTLYEATRQAILAGVAFWTNSGEK